MLVFSKSSFFLSFFFSSRPSPVLDLLTPEALFSCLQGCENSAPESDLLTYKHWKEADQRGYVFSKIFNFCLKVQDIPSSWKISSCILLPKTGDFKCLDNWRPIALSNTIYKLFSKCLTRCLQDWCEANDILSKCQKGFPPFDGAVEPNFVISQHLERARSHNDFFVIWLDIVNAIASILHEVLFSSLKNVGVDHDFVKLIFNIYSESFSKIGTCDGLTEPIPSLCGVKQGCPLCGILFKIAINHILVSLQADAESHSVLAFADDL
ncbi:retrovirus-related Pol polyprotein from type-1 retrotransposable element R2, partial [Nephila pilipes]